MKKYVGPMLSTTPNLNGDRLSDEVIKDILEKQPQVPVTVDFAGTSIGHTVKYTEEGSRVLCEINIDESQYPFLDLAYLVGMFTDVKFHMEGRVKVIDSANLQEAAITLLPSDPTLTRI